MSHSSLKILTAAVAFLAAASSAQAQLPIESRTSERENIIARQIRRIVEEKVRSHEPRSTAPATGRDGKAGSAVALMRAPNEIDVTASKEQEGELHAVVNPADSNNILISAIRTHPTQRGLTLPIYYTRDFGETWTQSDFQPEAIAGGDPVFTAASDGTIYFSWIEFLMGAGSVYNTGILWSSSGDGGETWTAPDTIAYSQLRVYGNNPSGVMSDKQWMAVDRSGSQRDGAVYTVFYEIRIDQTLSASIVVRRKPAGAGQFIRESVMVSDSTWAEVQFSSIAVDGRGDVHVFFYGRPLPSDRQWLWHAVSHDGAMTFETPTVVAPVRFPETQGNVPAFLPQRFSELPQFAVDASLEGPHAGNLYAVWFSNDLSVTRSPSINEPLHIYFARSMDRGTTWSEPMRMNDDKTAFRSDHVLPSIDVSPAGAVVVTWYDGRSEANNRSMHHYTAFSLDGGATFEGNIRVSTEGSDIGADVAGSFGVGDYTKCISTNGYAIPIWSDGRGNNGDLNIYAAFVPLREGPSGVEDLRVVSSRASVAIAPNPASKSASIRVTMRAPSDARIEIVNILGDVVATPFTGRLQTPTTNVDANLAGIPSGRYVVRVIGERVIATARLDVME